MSFLDTILEIIFPTKCVFCGKNGDDLCLECLSGAPAAERESAKWIYPVYDYRHPAIKKSLWLLKYKGKKRLAGVFAETLYEKIIEELSELSVMENFNQPILVPIPLASARYRERGFNQSELICKELIKINGERQSGIELKLGNNILTKTKDTVHQARIKNRIARLKNIAGSFEVNNPLAVKRKNIILIDDILTTGATLTEARKVLKRSGARKIIAFTLAH
ncbi:MAG TPA: ComF family protein [Candidatus Paceibacterota bacterium]